MLESTDVQHFTSYFSTGIIYSMYHFSFLSWCVLSKRNSITIIPGDGLCTESTQTSAKDRYAMGIKSFSDASKKGSLNWKLFFVLIREIPRHWNTSSCLKTYLYQVKHVYCSVFTQFCRLKFWQKSITHEQPKCHMPDKQG